MAYIETNRPISAIFADLINQFTLLVRKESQLARAEMSATLPQLVKVKKLISRAGQPRQHIFGVFVINC